MGSLTHFPTSPTGKFLTITKNRTVKRSTDIGFEHSRQSHQCGSTTARKPLEILGKQKANRHREPGRHYRVRDIARSGHNLGGPVFLKSIPKLVGVVAVVAAIGLGGSGVASAANPPSDGGSPSCAPDKGNCRLYHFKLDGDTHSMEFTAYSDACTLANPKKFNVQRKNSANIWLDPAVSKHFFISFDGRPASAMQGMELVGCGHGGGGVTTFVNNENKCWHLTELRSRGAGCDWR
ncbi:hypothetical protein JNUCC0626_47505 [Lentzea sp. JNUCC 0626]|uniref:hypothetical protein n=1 Tax=Lentzea sp. JNUCC 0626 TaxID=3367513 RepID=UPI00374A14AA